MVNITAKIFKGKKSKGAFRASLLFLIGVDQSPTGTGPNMIRIRNPQQQAPQTLKVYLDSFSR